MVAMNGTARAGLSTFAAVTDEPPLDVTAAGHDLYNIPIRKSMYPWLNPNPAELAKQYNRDRRYYEYRLAA
jgi:hypothetical protein